MSDIQNATRNENIEIDKLAVAHNKKQLLSRIDISEMNEQASLKADAKKIESDLRSIASSLQSNGTFNIMVDELKEKFILLARGDKLSDTRRN